MPILRHTIYGNLKAIIHILTDCPDANVRTAISDMVGHMILVSIASTNTVIHEADASSSEESESEISDEDIIKHVLKKLLALFKKDKKDTTYKKLKGFYRMWAYVIKNSSEILLWLVKENRFIERILSKRYLPQISTTTRSLAHTSRRTASANMNKQSNLSLRYCTTAPTLSKDTTKPLLRLRWKRRSSMKSA